MDTGNIGETGRVFYWIFFRFCHWDGSWFFQTFFSFCFFFLHIISKPPSFYPINHFTFACPSRGCGTGLSSIALFSVCRLSCKVAYTLFEHYSLFVLIVGILPSFHVNPRSVSEGVFFRYGWHWIWKGKKIRESSRKSFNSPF